MRPRPRIIRAASRLDPLQSPTRSLRHCQQEEGCFARAQGWGFDGEAGEAGREAMSKRDVADGESGKARRWHPETEDVARTELNCL